MAEQFDDVHRRAEAPHAGPAETAEHPADPAARSLSDALSVSFRLLRVIMIGVVVAFLATGVRSIEEQQIGIRKVFGKAAGTVGAGLAYNWPFPVGLIEVVDVRERTLGLSDFWMSLEPSDRFKDLSEVSIPSGGLKSGYDDALLTGDRNLMHVKLTCRFAVKDPIRYRRHVSDLDETVRSAVCAGAIRAAAGKTADYVWKHPQAFTDIVRTEAQNRLDLLTGEAADDPPAIEVVAIVLENRSWPLRARPAYEAAQRALEQKKQIVADAVAEANRTLNAAAGPDYEALVGRPWQAAGSGQDLIGQYERATAAGDERRVAELMGQIDALLAGRRIGGQASKIIAEAGAYKTATIESVKSRAERFNQLLPEFEKDPQFMLHRLWAAARDQILSAPTNEKLYLPMGRVKTVLKVNRDEQVRDRIRREKLKAARAAEQAEGG